MSPTVFSFGLKSRQQITGPHVDERLASLRNTIDDVKALALAKGGQCLSSHYLNRRSPLLWKCALGHRPWRASYSNVMAGTWCPTCGRSIHGTIDEMKQLASSRGGQCLSDRFVDYHTPLVWQCAKRHRWRAEPNNIIGRGRKAGSWCPKCARERLRGKKRLEPPTIDDMCRLAISRGGRCLSEFYVNAHSRLLWSCAEGHTWNAQPANVRRGSWCPFCARKAPRTLSQMQELAATWGGCCISKRFKNVHSALNWICSEGHIFRALPRNVLRGHWCPLCGKRPLSSGTLPFSNCMTPLSSRGT